MNNPPTTMPTDPFVGFFAEPTECLLELEPGPSEGTYRGWIQGDFRLPVQLSRQGNVLSGYYANESHPLEVTNTPQGLMVNADGGGAGKPLRRYKDRKAFDDWFKSNPH
jgi:hypothetical protein